MEGTCRLCDKHAMLRKSHIIPSFVFRWLKDSSARGHFRYGEMLNKRVQDGPKTHLLCADCEQSIGDYEKEFSAKIFGLLHNNTMSENHYGPWLLKFAVSVSWRVLVVLLEKVMSELPPYHSIEANHALSSWKEFLLGKAPSPGRFEQHMFFLGPVTDHTFDELPRNINRYLL